VILEELVKLFLDSRKRGTGGARKRCSAKTVAIYEANLTTFLGFLQTGIEGGSILDYRKLTRVHVMQFFEWLDERQKSGKWSRSTVLQHLRTIKAFFRWVDRDDECRELELRSFVRYLPTIEKNPRRTNIPQTNELRKFKNTFNTGTKWGHRDYVATCLMLTNGIRIGELCNLTLDNILWEQKLLYVTGKTGSRPVPITEEMVRLLKGWLKRRSTCKTAQESEYVFISKLKSRLEPETFGKALIKHRQKHGLAHISAHTLRHAFCTYYLKNGGDIEKLRNITGHSSYEMLKDYLHLAKVGGKAAQEELERVSLLKEV
jgi:integrase/recombinase XerD